MDFFGTQCIILYAQDCKFRAKRPGAKCPCVWGKTSRGLNVINTPKCIKIHQKESVVTGQTVISCNYYENHFVLVLTALHNWQLTTSCIWHTMIGSLSCSVFSVLEFVNVSFVAGKEGSQGSGSTGSQQTERRH